MHDDELDVFALQLAERLGAGFERTLHVRLEDHIQCRSLTTLNRFEEVFESCTSTGEWDVSGNANSLSTGLTKGAGVGLVLRDAHLITGVWWLGEAEHLDWR